MNWKSVLGSLALACVLLQAVRAQQTFHAYGGHWYTKLWSFSTWSQALNQAKAYGGYPVCLNSAGEETFVKTTFGSSQFRIGAFRLTPGGPFQWLSGEPFLYTNWCMGEPNNGGGGIQEDSVVMNSTTNRCWNDVFNNNIYEVIVEIPNGFLNPANGHFYALAPAATAAQHAINLAFESSIPRSFGDGAVFGVHLASITSAAENLAITSAFAGVDSGDWYVGLSDLASEGTFEWTTKESTGYSNWCPGEPNGFMGNEDSVVMVGARWCASNGDGRRWSDIGSTAMRRAVYEFDEPGFNSSRSNFSVGTPADAASRTTSYRTANSVLGGGAAYNYACIDPYAPVIWVASLVGSRSWFTDLVLNTIDCGTSFFDIAILANGTDTTSLWSQFLRTNSSGGFSISASTPTCAPFDHFYTVMAHVSPASATGLYISATTKVDLTPPPISNLLYNGSALGSNSAPACSCGFSINLDQFDGCGDGTFSFYGISYTECRISTSGRVVFGSGNADLDTSASVAEAMSLQPFVGFWTTIGYRHLVSSLQVLNAGPSVVRFAFLSVFFVQNSAALLPWTMVIELNTATNEITIEGLPSMADFPPPALAVNQFLGLSRGAGATNAGTTTFAAGGSGAATDSTSMIYDFVSNAAVAELASFTSFTPINGVRFTPIISGPGAGNYAWTGF